MTIEEKLKDLILNRYGSVVRFSEDTGLSNSTVATILTRGIHNASIGNVLKICKTLGISADELAHDRIVPTWDKLKAADINDIVSLIRCECSIDGTPLTEIETEMFLCAVEVVTEIIRRSRDKK